MGRLNPCYLACVIVLVTNPFNSSATTYYVSQNGNDKNTGRSWVEAWQTLELAGRSAKAGDQVIVRRGADPYKYLPVLHTGTEAEPIIFRGELKDNPPLISGGIKETRWEPTNKPKIWKARTSASPILVLEDGKPLVGASSQTCSDGNWFWGHNELWYRPTSGQPGDHDLWRANSGGGVQLGNNSWIIVEDFKCWLGQGACISIDEGGHNTIRRIHSQWQARGVQIRNGNHNLIENGIFENNREGVYFMNNASYNTIRDSKVRNNGNFPIWTKWDRSGIAIGEAGINIGNQIIGNEVAFNGGPKGDPGLIAYDAPETLIEGNYVHHNYVGGIVVGIRSHGSSAIANRVEKNGISAVQAGEGNVSGLSIRRSRGVLVKNNIILDNYVSPSDPGRYEDPIGAGIDLKGNRGEDMRETRFIGNVVCGTKNGPDTHFSSMPNTTGIVHEAPRTSVCPPK